MSSDLDLLSEFERLSLQVERLTIRVVELEDRLRESEAGLSASHLSGSRGSPSVVGAGPPSTAWSAVSGASSTGVARHIGRFLARGLSGQFRGSSGRDRLRLQNRYYLICKTFEGVALEEPILASSFNEVRQQCKRGSDCGLSLFVGFPTLWEARVAATEAGLPLPPALRNA